MFGRTVRFYLGGETGTVYIFVPCLPETPWAEVVEKAKGMIQSSLQSCHIRAMGLDNPVSTHTPNKVEPTRKP